MSAKLAILGATLVACQVAWSQANATQTAGPRAPGRITEKTLHAPPPRHDVAPPHHAKGHHAVRKVARASVSPPVDPTPAPAPDPGPPPLLSDQEEQVSQIAVAKGDHDFLMVDKTLGKLILFENGEPVYAGPALTGRSTADRLPPGTLAEKLSALNALATKVTPAGRFTVKWGYDRDYGELLDINEIRGKDWGIAIHQVYLGIPSEHRDERIKSPDSEERHITFGCINVEPETMRLLLRDLPKSKSTPLYILPEDETKTAEYFRSSKS